MFDNIRRSCLLTDEGRQWIGMAPKKPTRTERLAVRVTAELRADIERIAASERRTVSDWIGLTLEAAVEAADKSTKRSR